jgi:hypothetical protein
MISPQHTHLFSITFLLSPYNIGASSEGYNFIIKDIRHQSVFELVPLTEGPVIDAIPKPMAMADTFEQLTMMFRNQHVGLPPIVGSV